jgi:hypothetical protein
MQACEKYTYVKFCKKFKENKNNCIECVYSKIKLTARDIKMEKIKENNDIRERCSQCGRFPGNNKKCEEDNNHRLKVYIDSISCLNIV